MTRLYIAIVVGLALAGMGIFGWKHYETVVTERATFKRERDQAQASLAKTTRDKGKLDALLVARERERNAAAANLERQQHEINQLRADPATASWADTRLPDAALELVCRNAGACDDRPHAAAPDGADAGAGARGEPH